MWKIERSGSQRDHLVLIICSIQDMWWQFLTTEGNQVCETNVLEYPKFLKNEPVDPVQDSHGMMKTKPVKIIKAYTNNLIQPMPEINERRKRGSRIVLKSYSRWQSKLSKRGQKINQVANLLYNQGALIVTNTT